MGQRINAKAAYALTKNARALAAVGEDFEKVRQKLVQDHAKRDEAGEIVPGEQEDSVQIADAAAFQAEFVALLESEVEIDAHKVPFKGIENAEIAPSTLLLLDWMIDYGA